VSESGTETERLTHEAVALGRDGEPCAQCGSPLAADQRYCLNCGARRGGPRVDYRERMAAASRPAEPGSGPAPPADAEPAKPAKGERDYAPLAAVGGIAVLGLMLLVGVLIGRGDGGDPAPAPAPVVVQGGGAAAAEKGASGGGEGGEAGGGPGSGGKQENTGGGGKSETAAEAGAVTASEGQLEELESETGEEAAKNALKLPDKIATPGAPPPIDKSKPPGGGEGGGLVIK
jgi:hypothetical protein